MNSKIVSALRAANAQYRSYYEGGGVVLHARRMLRYPGKYPLRALARALGWRRASPVAARACWGTTLFVLLADKNAGALHYFGVLGEAEHPLSLYLAETLGPRDVFYDVGANYGFYSALAGQVVKKVHAFEPHPLLLPCLAKTFGERADIRVNPVALGEKGGEAELFYEEGVSGLASIARREGEVRTLVPVLSLDEYAAEHAPPSVVKIDAEGAELQVLQGGRKTLQTHRPRVIMEVWGGELSRYSDPATALLYKLGYRPYEISRAGKLVSVSHTGLQEKSSKTKYRNVVFLP